MEFKSRKSVTDNLSKYTLFGTKEGDYISVTEWENSEGWDIDINGKAMSLHYDELKAINYLVNVLDYEYPKADWV